MTDDLKERLRYGTVDPVTGEHLDLGVYAHVAHEGITAALAHITDLEARLAAAEAGENALAGALRGAVDTLRGASRQLTEFHRGSLKGRVWGQMTLEIVSAALAAYEARRG